MFKDSIHGWGEDIKQEASIPSAFTSGWDVNEHMEVSSDESSVSSDRTLSSHSSDNQKGVSSEQKGVSSDKKRLSVSSDRTLSSHFSVKTPLRKSSWYIVTVFLDPQVPKIVQVWKTKIVLQTKRLKFLGPPQKASSEKS